MKPIKQSSFGTEMGNCFSACIASLLELPLEEVPNFCADKEGWPRNAIDWLRNRGYAFIGMPYDDVPKEVAIRDMQQFGGYFIVSGTSPRFDCLHSVLYKDGKLIHDPHPDGDGVETIEYIEVLAAHDPRKEENQ